MGLHDEGPSEINVVERANPVMDFQGQASRMVLRMSFTSDSAA